MLRIRFERISPQTVFNCLRRVFAGHYAQAGAVIVFALGVGLTSLLDRFITAHAAGTITGAVYADYNMNGVRDTSGTGTNLALDIGVGGVVVTLYDNAGTQRGTATTCSGLNSPTAFCTGSNNGAYSITATGTGPYRMEFTNLPNGFSPSAIGANNASTVRFVANGNSSGNDLGVLQGVDYCQINPFLVTNVYAVGNGTFPTIGKYPYNYTAELDGNINGTTTAPPSRDATLAPTGFGTVNTIGSTFGISYDPRADKLYTAAFLKRHTRFGSLSGESTGAIYVFNDPSGDAPTSALYVDLNSVFGANTAGANPHPSATTADYTIDNDGSATSTPALVGKRGLGGLQLSLDGTKLYTVNLADRRLYVIPTSGTLNNTTITRFNIPTTGLATSSGNCVAADVRPFATGRDRSGNIYVGAVCSAESTQNNNQLHAYVWRFDGAAFTLVANNNLTFLRRLTTTTTVQWLYWENATLNALNRAAPMLTDLAFDDASMVLGFRDRYSDISDIVNLTDNYNRGYGDIMRACANGTNFTFETNGACGGLTTAGANTAGNGGGEFYIDLNGDGRDEGALGGLTQIPGYNHVLTTMYDAVTYNSAGTRIENFYTAGTQRYHNTSGAQTGAYDIYLNSDTGTFGKSGGVGDSEPLCKAAPLELGNRIWNDADGDGVQDSAEATLTGVAVQLWEDTDGDGIADTQVGAATTDATGNYLFGGANRTNMIANATCTGSTSAQVSASANDSEESATVSLVTGTALDLARTAGAVDNLIGLRFGSVNIPAGANVTAAAIQFTGTTAANTGTGAVSVRIRGENADNSTAFTTGAGNISGRAMTTQAVDWSAIPAWTNGTANAASTTPNLESLVDAVTGRAGWQTGNSLTFIIANTGTTLTNSRAGQSYDTAPATAPVLNIAYQCPSDVRPNRAYEVRLPTTNFAAGQPLNTFTLTRVNADATANGDSRDSDATYADGIIKIEITTGDIGANNHTYDLGLTSVARVSLGNRVFNDANNNGVLDAGETGIANVVVNLYDSAGTTLLGMTTTDASGYYSFPGLVSGTTYLVEIAAGNFNSGGALYGQASSTGANGSANGAYEGASTPNPNTVKSDTDDNGTTTSSLGSGGVVRAAAVTVTAGSAPTGETNGAGDINADNRSDLTIDFGFFTTFSVGNRLWYDTGTGTGGVANDGVRNGTEASVPNATVQLLDGATNAVIATATTNASGYYRFDNVRTGSYKIRVPASNFQAGGIFFGTSSNNWRSSAGVNNTTEDRDHGVDNAAPQTNGITSNAFTLGPTANAPVNETDISNGSGAINPQSDLTIDFGFFTNAPTFAHVFEASGFYLKSRGVLLRWRTSLEADNLGFNLYRAEGDKLVRVNRELIAGSALMTNGVTLTAGSSYSFWDAQGDADSRYVIEDVDLGGRRTPHGTLSIAGTISDQATARALADVPASAMLNEINSQTGANANTGQRMRLPQMLSEDGNLQRINSASRVALAAEGNQAAFDRQRQIAQGAAVKIAVRETGWYRVSAARLYAAGLAPNIDAKLLQLYADGEEQSVNVRGVAENGALSATTGAIEFYGVRRETRESDERTYWLVAGNRPGVRIGAPVRVAGGFNRENGGVTGGTKDKSETAPYQAQNYPQTVELKQRNIFFAALQNGEDAENFFGAVVSSAPVEQRLTINHLDGAATYPADLTLAIQGGTDVDHRVRVELNGSEIGVLEFAARERKVAHLPLVQSALREGENVVTLTALGNAPEVQDISLMDYARLTYARRYMATDAPLISTVTARRGATLDGFANANVRVLDVTDAARAFELAVRPEVSATGYAVKVGGSPDGRVYVAFTDEQVLTPARVEANAPSAWTTREQGADLIILTTAELQPAAETLAQARRAQGMQVAVINVADIYDEWNGGMKNAPAVTAFLAWARANWQHAPQYLLLLGDASFDPRNYTGYGVTDLVPSRVAPTAAFETVSDEMLVDFDGDGVGELSVGRLPARNPAQAQTMVAKVLAYQPANIPATAVFVSDNQDVYNFAATGTALRAELPPEMSVTEINRADAGANTREQVRNAFNAGAAIVTYAGHGSVEVWANEGVWSTNESLNLQNGAKLPFVISLTCLNGYFQDLYTESIAEGLMRAPQGGAIGVWASSSLTPLSGQDEAAAALLHTLYQTGSPARIGDAVRQAKYATQSADVRRSWILFTDPTLQLR